MEKLHKNVNRFMHGPPQAGVDGGSPPVVRPDIANRGTQRIGELVNLRHTDIKV